MEREDRMRRAEDYVFGLMDEQERERAERDMVLDPAFRESVLSLAERLRTQNRTKQPALSDAAWGEIAERIARMPQMGAAGTAAAQATFAMPPAPDPARKGHLMIKRPYAHQFGGWRGTVVALCLIAAMAVGYLAGQATAPAPRPLAVAILADQNGQAGALVEAYAADALRVLPLAAVELPAHKVLQVWTYSEANTPVPLGALSRVEEARLVGPQQPAPQPGQRYEITIEDAPGSSAGRPVGALLFSGEAIAPPR